MRIARLILFLAAALTVWGEPPAGNPSGNPSHRDGPPPPPPPVRSRGPFEGPGGKWWDNADMVKRLEITPEQQKKMEDAFQQSRPRLIDLQGALAKEEIAMEGLMKGPQLDDSKILPVVDRIAQARAELEKTDARLQLAIRHVLTPEQWQKLVAEKPRPHHEGPPIKPGPPPPVREE